jgi:hypothetical protein
MDDDKVIECTNHWHSDTSQDRPCPSCGERPIDIAGLIHALKGNLSWNQYEWARKNPGEVAKPWWQ